MEKEITYYAINKNPQAYFRRPVYSNREGNGICPLEKCVMNIEIRTVISCAQKYYFTTYEAGELNSENREHNLAPISRAF